MSSGAEHGTSFGYIMRCMGARNRFITVVVLATSLLLHSSPVLAAQQGKIDTWRQYNLQAVSDYRDQHFADAEDCLNKALAEARRENADFRVVLTLRNLADVYIAQARYAKAEQIYRELLAREQNVSTEPIFLVSRLKDLSNLYRLAHNYGAAETWALKALAIQKNYYGPNHDEVGKTVADLALLYNAAGNPAKEEEQLINLLNLVKAAPHYSPYRLVDALSRLSQFYQDGGDNKKCLSYGLQGLQVFQTTKQAKRSDSRRIVLLARIIQARLGLQEDVSADWNQLIKLVRQPSLLTTDNDRDGQEHAGELRVRQEHANEIAESMVRIAVKAFDCHQLALSMASAREALPIAPLSQNPDTMTKKCAAQVARVLIFENKFAAADAIIRQYGLSAIDTYTWAASTYYGYPKEFFQSASQQRFGMTMMEKSCALEKHGPTPDKLQISECRLWTALYFHAREEPLKAEPLMTEAIRLKQEFLGKYHSSLVYPYDNFAHILITRRKFSEAQHYLQLSSTILSREPGKDPNGALYTKQAWLVLKVKMAEQKEP